MGKLRSKDGCLTCRSRHVKCDEQRPVCGRCTKANRQCRRDDRQGVIIRHHQPRGTTQAGRAHTSPLSDISHASPIAPEQNEDSQWPIETYRSPQRSSLSARSGPSITIAHLLQPESTSTSPRFHHEGDAWPLVAAPGADSASTSPTIPRTLARHEARLVNHYAVHLGGWLDCTDASRQFSLKIPALAASSPILLEAIISFAARHAGDADAADAAHERCIALLIVLLNADDVADDDVLLCAIVILRVFEQLNAVAAGSDQERHLAGSSALLRASQGSCADPSAPGLREAAFWVYMRQCLYNACINQQPPNVDFSLTLLPVPSPSGNGAVDDLRAETAWANTMTWICATVVQFSFGGGASTIDGSSQVPSTRARKWQDLRDAVDSWAKSRPGTFDPNWESSETCPAPGGSPFPEYYFTADWHVVAFGLYHLSCMLLQIYRPNPRFAIRNIHSGASREMEFEVLEHARAICGSCWNAPQTVPARITLSQTVFIWGALMTNPVEQAGLTQLLQELERDHAWPTAWIISSLNEEWGVTP